MVAMVDFNCYTVTSQFPEPIGRLTLTICVANSVQYLLLTEVCQSIVVPIRGKEFLKSWCTDLSKKTTIRTVKRTANLKKIRRVNSNIGDKVKIVSLASIRRHMLRYRGLRLTIAKAMARLLIQHPPERSQPPPEPIISKNR